MRYFLIIFISMLCGSILEAQPNCEVLKDDISCYKSCNKAWRAIRYKQGSFKSQRLFDESIDLCPSFAYSYMEKAVPYLKRGEFIQWKKLIDQAVELSPSKYLGYRGWCRIQFLRDYEGAIKDIERLKQEVSYDIGYCQNGNYHLEVALGLCYKELGDLEKAQSIISNHVHSSNYSSGLFDYYHLGVIEYELGNYQTAKNILETQLENNELAEVYYYLALTFEKLNRKDEYSMALNKSEQLYLNGNSMYDNYTEPIDKLYLSDILKEKSRKLKIDKK